MDPVVLLLVCVAPLVRCYSSGQVMDSCEDMRPHHSGLSPQTEPAPFTITTDLSSYRPGGEVKVMLQAPASTPFTGFLLQAREVAGRSPVGSFALTPGTAQLLTCNQTPNTAVSHTSASVKTSVQVTWRSEASGDMKRIQFHASFVQSYRTFWVDVISPVVNFTNDGPVGSTSLPMTPTTTTIINPPAAPVLQLTSKIRTSHSVATLSVMMSWTIPLPPRSQVDRGASVTSANCGVTKVCFSQPSNCDPPANADCYFMSAMMLSPTDATIRYEMTGPSDGYIAFGFSDDQMMGNDDIYICGMTNNGLVHLQHAFSTGRTTPQVIPLGNVSDVRASVQDGVISCSFTTMDIVSTQRTTGFNQTYHLIFAYGPSSNGRIQLHTGTFVSSNKVDLSRPQHVRKAGWPHIIKAHGALMLIAWMTLASLGMMVARYRKGATKRQLCGKDVWFVVHVAVMSVMVAATIIAFILSFSYVKAWSGGAHPVLGCLVLILSFLQPIMALLRCGPQHPQRFLFNWAHALNGLSSKVLAVAAVFTGLKLIDSTLDRWLMKVMGGLVGWEALFYMLLEVHFKWKLNSADTDTESKLITADGLLMVLFFLGNLTFVVALLVGIGMS